MLSSIIGGGLVALTFFLIARLRGGGAREPKPFWARSEMLQSLLAVMLVCMVATGVAMVLSSFSKGLIAVLVGLAVAVGGSALAFILAPRRAAPASARMAAAGTA